MTHQTTCKAVVRYVGTNFSGWQVQPNRRTVQGEIASAIGRIAGEEVIVHGASRTDAGVHGWGQVVSGRLPADADLQRVAHSVNRLLGPEIAVPRGALPETGKDQYYWSDLEGLRVVHRDGTVLGRVAYLLETGANDVMVVEGEQERLIPFVTEKVVLGVDLDKGEIEVDWEWD